jgi:hypothetical protein
MAEKNDANKDASKKKSGLTRKFGLAAGALVLAGGLTVGGAAAINGVNHEQATTADGASTLERTTISPVFEKQTFNTPDANYWCWSVASIPCPIPVDDGNKPVYNALKQQLKK